MIVGKRGACVVLEEQLQRKVARGTVCQNCILIDEPINDSDKERTRCIERVTRYCHGHTEGCVEAVDTRCRISRQQVSSRAIEAEASLNGIPEMDIAEQLVDGNLTNAAGEVDQGCS